MALDVAKVEELKRRFKPRADLPFKIGKLGHIVINCADIERSLEFYTERMGFECSDIYTDDMAPGGMAFLRCGPDPHSIATLDEVLRARDHLAKHNVKLDFEGRRRAGVQIAVEFRDPDNHRLEIFWGLDQLAPGQKARPRTGFSIASSLEEAIENPVRGQDTRLRDPSLARKLSAEEIERQKQHSLKTQTKKLGATVK